MCAASAPLIISEQNRTRMRKTQRAAERIPSISSLPLFNNQRFQNAAIHMEVARHANYPFARQTTKGLIQSTDKFAHSKNAGCLSQSRRKLQRRIVASEMAICYSQSDQFNSRSNRTMIGRCGNWTRMPQGGNMPVSLKTQAERTAKAPIPACHARVGSLCGFPDTVERVSPPEARRPDVAPPCGSVAEMANAEEGRLQAAFGRGRSRKRRSSRLWICQGIKMQKR